MTSITTAKLALAAGGIILFGIGIRFENATLRWTGTGFVAAALILRFVKGRRDN
jgi:hypothetical protein